MQITAHQTSFNIADFSNIFSYLEEIINKDSQGIHLFPELFLTGYPLQDLCVQRSFYEAYSKLLKKIESLSKKINQDTVLLLGGLDYSFDKSGIPQSIKNIIFELSSTGLKPVYTKQLLPNYDIFDEQKYFTPGDKSTLWNYKDKTFALLICEDMWSSSFHHKDPVDSLQKEVKSKKIDAIINLSASPYTKNKIDKRKNRAKYIANLLKAPFIYLNKVGGEDEILFDGSSFICDGKSIHKQLALFKEDTLKVDLNSLETNFVKPSAKSSQNTWEDLFVSNIQLNKGEPPTLEKWTDDECEEVLQALMFGFQQYASKSGFQNFTIALSGGIDSALVLAIIRLALKEGQYLEAIYMPSIYSSPLSWELSTKLCQNLGIPLSSLPIKFLHSAAKNLFGQSFQQPFEGLTDENIQARLRGTLLYTRSNQINSMVVNTSNKSELSVGYSTQYGDSVGAISLLGDLFKSEVYQLCEYINKTHSNLIPKEIITRPPTAELRPDQKDSDSLPEYHILDAILDGILSYRMSKSDLIKSGFDQKDVEQVLNLYRRCEYKRYQFCPIIKVSSKSFGFGYRVPISKSSTFYIED